MHKMIFHPIGNAESIQIDLDNGQKILFDYADQRDPENPDDLRIDLGRTLKDDLRNAKRDYFDVVAFTHLDDDHIQGATDFFYLEHAAKYQGEGRIKIKTLWVPAAAIIEEGSNAEAQILRAEARHRLREGAAVRVFSRPKQLEDWLEDQGLTLEDRRDLITDAGQIAPDFSLADHGVEFFIHSPFGHRLDDKTVIDRNENALVVQARFIYNDIMTQVLLTADVPCEQLAEMIDVTQYYGNDDRLKWDVIDVPHHCSYLSLSPDKGKDKTKPLEGIKWLYEEQAQPHGIIVSSSKPIPSNDDDNQPPHRQAANYYKDCARAIDGEFIVTMEHPTKKASLPLVITIDASKATVKRTPIGVFGIISSNPSPRAG